VIRTFQFIVGHEIMDAHGVVDGVRDVGWCDRALERIFAVAVAGTEVWPPLIPPPARTSVRQCVQ